MSDRVPAEGSAGADPTRSAGLVRELVARLLEELRACWQRGERVPVEAYLEQHPGLRDDAEAALLLVYQEVVLREQRGEAPQLQEYLRRFPQWAPQLRDQFELDEALGSSCPVASAPGRDITALTVGSPPPHPPPDGLPTVPGYEVIRELGRGGMGVVYWAWQTSLARTVALKMILAGDYADARELARFRTEAEAVARLQHPSIVQIYEVGHHGGRPYMALEYVDGGSLAQKLAGTPLAADQAAQLAETLARAVHAAHQRGIIHRDLTPGNVLLTADGLPKITDFGLAKVLAGGAAVPTQTGSVLGTPSYMAPEQAKGLTREVGPAADVYALGAILYEMLTGRPPFKAETPLATIQQVQTAEPVPPSRLQPHLPRDLSTVCLKCLSKEPAKRYASALELAEDLRRFRAGEPIRARRTPWHERTWRWCRRNPVVAGLTGVVALLLVLIAGASSLTALYLHATLGESEANRLRAEEAERDGKAKLWQAHLDRAQARRVSRQPGQRFDSLRAIQEALKLPVPPGRSLDELRNEAIAALVLPDLKGVKEWEGLLPSSNNWTFDAALQRYARAEPGGAVSIRQGEDNAEFLRLPSLGPLHDFHGLQFSPDGCFLHRCYRRDNRWRGNLCRINGPRPVVVLDEAYSEFFAFSLDSRQLAAAYPDGTLCFYDVASGGELRRFPFKEAVRCLRWNPRAPQLAMHNGNRLRIVHVETGQVLAEWTVPGGPNWMDWHPGGRLLAVGTHDLKIHLWDSATGQPVLPPLEGHKNGGLLFLFHPAGDLLASNDYDGIVRLWDVNTGRQVLAQHGAGTWPQFRTPEGSLLAGANERRMLQLSRCARGSEFRTLLLPHKEVHYHPILNADGRLLAVPIREKGIDLIDLSDGQLAAEIPVPGSWPFLFEPSGALLTRSKDGGLLRWPRTLDPLTGRCRFGPPERLYEWTAAGRGGSTDGRVLALAHHSRGAIVLYRDTGRRVLLQPQEDVRSCAISPDGRWVATGSWGTIQGVGAKVWDAQSGQLVKELPVGGFCAVAFSADGRWLATSAGGCRLWRVGSWEEGLKLGGGYHFAFSPDSRVLAVAGEAGVVRLVDPNSDQENAREYARLTGPDPIRLYPVCFTPDGAQLITWASETRAIHIFDLRAIRRQLAEMGLDWDLPAYEPVKHGAAAKPLKVKVDLGNAFHLLTGDDRTSIGLNSFLLALNPFNREAYLQRGLAHGRRKEAAKAIVDYSLFLAIAPPQDKRRAEVLFRRSTHYTALNQHAQALADLLQLAPLELDASSGLRHELARTCNNTAWRLVTGPEKERDPAKALPLAKKAVELVPDQWFYANTLGVVYYRLGRYEPAIAMLQRSLRESKDRAAAFDLFFLAMCHHRLGDAAQARDCFDRAVKWCQGHKSLTAQDAEDLKAFRAEADALLQRPAPP
jgi:WD40 repeat protein